MPSLHCLAAVLALVATGCASAKSGPHASPGAFAHSHLDGAAWREYVAGDYVRTGGWVLPTALAAGALLVAPVDDRLSDAIDDSLGGSPTAGDVGVYAVVVGSLALGAVRPGPGRNAWDQSWSNLEALWLAYAVTEALKGAFPRERPDGSTSTSFPSGHATVAFTAATLVYREAGPAWGVPAYALAGLTAYSRVEAGRHFPTDVLVGAALGTLVGGVVDSLHFGAGPGRGIAGRCRCHVGACEGGVGVGVSLDL